VTHVPRQPAQSSIDVVLIGGDWMVQQRMTAEDAREVAYAFGERDGVFRELMDAAEDVDTRNETAR
jgi:hypothetical protein